MYLVILLSIHYIKFTHLILFSRKKRSWWLIRDFVPRCFTKAPANWNLCSAVLWAVSAVQAGHWSVSSGTSQVSKALLPTGSGTSAAWAGAPRAGCPALKYGTSRLPSTAKCGREEWDSLSRSEISVGEIPCNKTSSQKWTNISQSVRDVSYHTDKEKSPKASLGAHCCAFINRLITVGVLY